MTLDHAIVLATSPPGGPHVFGGTPIMWPTVEREATDAVDANTSSEAAQVVFSYMLWASVIEAIDVRGCAAVLPLRRVGRIPALHEIVTATNRAVLEEKP